jgi:glycosyltransferase involved in cell wall biosynthesis
MKNNPEIWAKHIYLLMADERLSKQMGNNGYKKLAMKYSIDNQVDELEKLYKMLIAGERNNTQG